MLLRIPGLFRFFAKFRSVKKRLLIIKTDAIGDYVLSRNFIEIVKASQKYKDHEIDLLGNNLWKDLTLKYDSPFVSNFFFIDPDGLYESSLKVLKLGWRLFKNNYEAVLQPTFARTLINDGLAGLTAAKQIVGFSGDTERINIKYKTGTDRFYTEKLSLPAGIDFEFERSKFFFENVLNQPVAINGPYILVENSKQQGIILFPGAGVAKRNWEPEKFLELIKLIRQQNSEPVLLAGGPGDIAAGDYISANLPPGSINNLIGKTSLPQLVELIGNAALVIANETSAIHIAAATKTKSVCILGGGHFNRFAPYPGYMENKPVCVFEKMDCYYCNWNCIFKTGEKEPYPCISAVSVEKVWQEVLPLIS